MVSLGGKWRVRLCTAAAPLEQIISGVDATRLRWIFTGKSVWQWVPSAAGTGACPELPGALETPSILLLAVLRAWAVFMTTRVEITISIADGPSWELRFISDWKGAQTRTCMGLITGKTYRVMGCFLGSSPHTNKPLVQKISDLDHSIHIHACSRAVRSEWLGLRLVRNPHRWCWKETQSWHQRYPVPDMFFSKWDLLCPCLALHTVYSDYHCHLNISSEYI